MKTMTYVLGGTMALLLSARVGLHVLEKRHFANGIKEINDLNAVSEENIQALRKNLATMKPLEDK